MEPVNYTFFLIDVWDRGLVVPAAHPSSALITVWTESGQSKREGGPHMESHTWAVWETGEWVKWTPLGPIKS
jgi:hypothetical protein